MVPWLWAAGWWDRRLPSRHFSTGCTNRQASVDANSWSTCVQDATDEIAIQLRHVAAHDQAQRQGRCPNRSASEGDLQSPPQEGFGCRGCGDPGGKRREIAVRQAFCHVLDQSIKDIEKAAKLSYAHGSKPSTLSDEEWALVLSHRSRGATGRARRTVKKTMAAKKPASAKAQASKKPARRTRTRSAAKTKAGAAAVNSNASTAVGSV